MSNFDCCIFKANTRCVSSGSGRFEPDSGFGVAINGFCLQRFQQFSSGAIAFPVRSLKLIRLASNDQAVTCILEVDQSVFGDLLIANKRYSKAFALAGLAPRAARELALVTCMDSRIEPLAMLGLIPGDAKILRNAGGRVTQDVLRSLIFATSYLGVKFVVVMQHTKCALTLLSEDEVKAHLRSDDLEVGDQPFLTMSDPDSALAADVELVRSCRSLPQEITVEGWRYDVDNGSILRLVL